MTGLHGAAYNGEIIAIGFYYNDEVQPNGRQYSVSNKLAPSPTISRPGQNRPTIPINEPVASAQSGTDNSSTILIAITLAVIIIFGTYVCFKLN